MIHAFFSFRRLSLSWVISVLFTSAVPAYAAGETTLQAVRVKASPVYESYITKAKVMPYRTNFVYAPRDGKIVQSYVVPGDKVTQGQLLAVINPLPLQEEKITLSAEFEDLSAHLKRVEDLVSRELISAEIWERNMHKVAQLKARLDIINEELANSRIVAPAAGQVLWQRTEGNEDVQGAEMLYMTGDAGKIKLRAKLPEQILNSLKQDQSVAILSLNTDQKKDVVLGTIEFQGLSGPTGEDDNLFIAAPRSAGFEQGETVDVVIAVPGQEAESILPEDVILNGAIWGMIPIEIEPNRYAVRRFPIDIREHRNGIAFFKSNLGQSISILKNPPESLKDGDIVTVLSIDTEWDSDLATSVLGPDWAARHPNSQTASSGGGCSAAGGVALAESDIGKQTFPGENVEACLVPAHLFTTGDVAAIDTAIGDFLEIMAPSKAPSNSSEPSS